VPPIEVDHLIVAIVEEFNGRALLTDGLLNPPPSRRFSPHSPHRIPQ
jgi:hypothetical protein